MSSHHAFYFLFFQSSCRITNSPSPFLSSSVRQYCTKALINTNPIFSERGFNAQEYSWLQESSWVRNRMYTTINLSSTNLSSYEQSLKGLTAPMSTTTISSSTSPSSSSPASLEKTVDMESAIKKSRIPIVFLLGGPGSGKGTQAEKLVHDWDMKQVCVGDVLREEVKSNSDLGRRVKSIIESGNIVPGEMLMRVLGKVILAFEAHPDAATSHSRDTNKVKGILLDGFPRAIDQAKEYEKLIGYCDKVIYFDCDIETMRQRLTERSRLSGRADDNKQVIEKRLVNFLADTLPLVDYYRQKNMLATVDASTDQYKVYVQVNQVLQAVFDSRHEDSRQ